MLEITRKIAIFICFFFTGFHIGLEQVWSLIVKLVSVRWSDSEAASVFLLVPRHC